MEEYAQIVKKHFHNAGIALSDEQAIKVAELDTQWGAVGFPGFAWHLCRIIAAPTIEQVERMSGIKL